MNIQGQKQKYGHLIVAGGALIALIGFFFLPYVTMSSKAATSSSAPPLILSAIQAAAIEGFIWLDALLAVGILLLALQLAYSRNPFGMSQMALAKQVQRGIYIIIGVGVVSLLLQYILMTTIPGQYVGMVSSNTPGFSSEINSFVADVAMSYNTGSWFFLVGMLAVIGGGVYVLMQMRPAQVAPAPSYVPPAQYPQMNQQNAQSPSAPTYQQNWQDPAQSQPTQYSQGQYPNQQQWQQPPAGYPPTQQSWPPQQPQPPYPPSSQG